MKSLTQRPMRKIYLEASTAATSLSMKATKISTASQDAQDKQTASDIAFAAKTFSYKAQKAADTLLTLFNDGALKAYCEQFDKTFERFSNDALIWERELSRIERKNV